MMAAYALVLAFYSIFSVSHSKATDRPFLCAIHGLGATVYSFAFFKNSIIGAIFVASIIVLVIDYIRFLLLIKVRRITVLFAYVFVLAFLALCSGWTDVLAGLLVLLVVSRFLLIPGLDYGVSGSIRSDRDADGDG